MRKGAIRNFNFVVFSRGVFRLFAWRLFVSFSPDVISSFHMASFRGEKMRCVKTERRHKKRLKKDASRKDATRKDVMRKDDKNGRNAKRRQKK